MRIVTTVLVACLLMACGEKDLFNFSGQIEGVSNDQLIIANKAGVIDTIEVIDGKFYYSRANIDTDYYRLTLLDAKIMMDAILENGTLNLMADASKAERGYLQRIELTGSINHELLNKYFNFSEELIHMPRYKHVLDKRNEMISIPREQFQDVKAKYEAAGVDYFKEVWDNQKALLENNNDKFFVTQVIFAIKAPATDAEVKAIYKSMPEQLKQHPNVVEVIKDIHIRESIAPGKIAPDFTLKDREGEPISLSDLKGKYVLIDFWASWCKPCRKSFPHMKELYHKYHNKGFEILGIANDTNEKMWLNALDEDDLPWLNVQEDFSGQRSGRVIGMYGFTHLPSTILIDPKGKIVTKLLHGDELDQQLKNIFEN
ncbi:MAG: redoxin domain-containing protein [Carboxylicivirga sp.]|nr:redoxin domain-containing protein [Carboxylicivirga sp.]